MDKVVVVYEDCYGLIAIAASYLCAVSWLIDNNWLTLDTKIWDKEMTTWVTVREQFGDDAFKHFFQLTIDEFNELFEACFKFVEMYVV